MGQGLTHLCASPRRGLQCRMRSSLFSQANQAAEAMTDTAQISSAIAAMIRSGATGQALVVAIAARYPELT